MRAIRAAAVLAALALSGCNPPTLARRPPLPVRVTTAETRDYAPALTLSGEVAARVSSNLSFRVSGRVIARNVDVGQHVEAGDALAQIDPASPQADLDAANAAVASGEALLKQNTVAFDRQKQLLDSGYTTRSGFDAAQQNIRTAQGALDAAKAQAAAAADALSYTTLKASHAGVVTARQIDVGQIALAAQTAFTVAEDGPRDAVFNVFEAVFFARPAGSTVQLTLISDPNVRATGHVREISPTLNTKAGTVTVKVAVDENADRLPLGAAVTGRAAFAPRKVVELPWTAAASDAGALAVWLVDPASGAVALKRVTAEGFENATLLVADGLAGGEQVVTAGGKFLYPGEIVAPLDGSP